MGRVSLLVVLVTVMTLAVSAAPPFQGGEQGESLTVVYPKQETYAMGSNVTLSFHVFNVSGYAVGNDTIACEMHLYGDAGAELADRSLLYDGQDFYAYFDVTNETGVVSYIVWCNGSVGAGYLSTSFRVTVDGESVDAGDAGLLAAVIFIPLVLALLLVWGSAALSAEHSVLKIFLYLLSVPLVLFSFHLGVVSVVKVYHFPELTDAVSSGVYWIGLTFAVIIMYFILYVFVQLVKQAAQKKKARLEY